MAVPPASFFLIVVLGLLACVVAFPGRLAVPLPRWRLAASAVLLAAAALILLYLPPHNTLREPEVWLVGLLFVLAGIGRGAWIRLQVDHGQGKLRLARAPDEFWVAVAALLLLLVDIAGEPFGRTGSVYVKAVELALVMLAGFLVGRNAALLVRSRDAPQHDL
jgi:hypothetical protein